jgi:hypothetical protein
VPRSLKARESICSEEAGGGGEEEIVIPLISRFSLFFPTLFSASQSMMEEKCSSDPTWCKQRNEDEGNTEKLFSPALGEVRAEK